jgi:hypothetical protein
MTRPSLQHDRPLTPRQEDALRMYAEHGTLTHAELAQLLHLPPSQRRRGPWSGWQNPAQRVIGTVIGLDRRGLVRLGRRNDGLSGTAYQLTDEGRRVAETLR